MRAIHWARLDKIRPVVLLTREHMQPHLLKWTVVPITTTMSGAPTEVHVGIDEGLDHDSVLSFDNVQTVPRDNIFELIGYLGIGYEPRLTAALISAYDLRIPPRRSN